MNFWEFIKTKIFFRQLAYAVLFVVVLLWIMFKIMNVYTRHGDMIDVPDFSGVAIEELDKFIENKPFTYKIVDSIYDERVKKRGVVVKQDPEPLKKVKEGRTIYLYVTARLSQRVAVPKLVDRSLRQALSMLETYSLKQGNIEFIVDAECINCVLEQKMNGKRIEPGTLVDKGTRIDLVIGKEKDNLDKEFTFSKDSL